VLAEETYTTEKFSLAAKVKDYVILIKFRLSALVVVSAIAGYLIAAPVVDGLSLLYLIIGGFLVTGSSNAFNQVIEREFDKNMERTKNRPVAAGRMSVAEGLIASFVMGIGGVFLLWMLNPLSAVLGFLALFMYVVIYTPLKRVTPWAVFVGAFPGAIPPMVGYIAFTGDFDLTAGMLFFVPFMWLFPQFWAIAWKIDDDYKKAGFSLLPTGKRDKGSAFQIMLYSLILIPVSLFPWVFDLAGLFLASVSLVASTLFYMWALRFYRSMEMKHATFLMFASFLYLPIVQFAYVIDVKYFLP
jgi:protoheme IX farnesyltransferase